ncbi:unnamed protein product [Brassicogethes aeneus]|uniref:Uncharacterized protein n=1 Tax=Brassicogethes aeneus TaxID=1431903 RepID=A0A9P0FC47_BRAAE|nr:unnamed protein product [Brassicogethes aeneus]
MFGRTHYPAEFIYSLRKKISVETGSVIFADLLAHLNFIKEKLLAPNERNQQTYFLKQLLLEWMWIPQQNYRELQFVQLHPVHSILCDLLHTKPVFLNFFTSSKFIMNSEAEITAEETSKPSGSSIVFEASTQTPTNEVCDSPLFTQKGYCLNTKDHSTLALNNIQKMREHGQEYGLQDPIGLMAYPFMLC